MGVVRICKRLRYLPNFHDFWKYLGCTEGMDLADSIDGRAASELMLRIEIYKVFRCSLR